MDYNQYVKLVKERASFSTDDDAVRSMRTVLEVLSERLSAGEAEDLRALLPKELKPYLSMEGQADQFGVKEFLTRIGAREGVDASIARYHAQAVLSVLASAVPTNELIDALSQLPGEIRELFKVENWIKRAA